MNPIDCVLFIIAAAQALFDHKEEINRLNVFPVPDGDTGTNMSLTLETVIQELTALGENPTFLEIRRAITHGSLMGARGNSGVITSQILRGFCEGVEGFGENEPINTLIIASALNRAVEVAFGAVRKPVEGTILTVLRDASDAAQKADADGLELDAALQAISKEAFASVRRTPDLLPILKENGVVDAGGYGLAILMGGFIDAATGVSTKVPDADALLRSSPKVAIEQINDWEDSEYLYCTEFLLSSDSIDSEEALSFLAGMGDCELLVGSHPNFKIHVHTNEPGTVLSYMTERGHVSEVHIHNMKIQTEQRNVLLQNTETVDTSTEQASALANQTHNTHGASVQGASMQPPKPIGFVAVCSGEGTQKIFESAGVDYVVHGGQTMNPSTKDFVDAINAVNSEAVVVFPNNKNVILAANAAADIVEKPVRVIPTISVPQSFAALFVSDPNEDLQRNVELMNEAIEHVHSGEITTAIKDAKAEDGRKIKKGDVIGISDGAISCIGKNLPDVSIELIGIIAKEADVLTLLAGKELEQDAFEELIERIEETYPDLEIDAQRGEQPLYPLVMSAE